MTGLSHVFMKDPIDPDDLDGWMNDGLGTLPRTARAVGTYGIDRSNNATTRTPMMNNNATDEDQRGTTKISRAHYLLHTHSLHQLACKLHTAHCTNYILKISILLISTSK